MPAPTPAAAAALERALEEPSCTAGERPRHASISSASWTRSFGSIHSACSRPCHVGRRRSRKRARISLDARVGRDRHSDSRMCAVSSQAGRMKTGRGDHWPCTHTSKSPRHRTASMPRPHSTHAAVPGGPHAMTKRPSSCKSAIASWRLTIETRHASRAASTASARVCTGGAMRGPAMMCRQNMREQEGMTM